MEGFDLEGIDEVIHGRLRLGIMAYLAHAEAADFTELKTALKATQGNLSIHLRKLEEAGYVTIQKTFVDRVPRTLIRLTDEGRDAVQRYNRTMQRVLDELLGKRQ